MNALIITLYNVKVSVIGGLNLKLGLIRTEHPYLRSSSRSMSVSKSVSRSLYFSDENDSDNSSDTIIDKTQHKQTDENLRSDDKINDITPESCSPVR